MDTKYIYGFIEEKTGAPAICSYEGIYTIPYKDICAVVSDSQFVDYAALPKNEVARYLLRHQQVIEKVMAAHAIIPVRLGTYAFHRREVEEILSRGYKKIKDIFKQIENKIEIDLAATWSDLGAVIREVAGEEEIGQFKQTLLNKKEGVTADDQMKIGVMVQNHLKQKRNKYALEIQTCLSGISELIKVHDLMDDNMVMNSAFLINWDKQISFETTIEELNTRFEDKLNFRCVGPLPPYSFYTLEIKKMQSEEIEWAKKKLGLNGFTNRNDIKKAYYRQAFISHPDQNPDTPHIENEFSDVARAYSILVDCCLAAEQTDQEDSCSFNGGEFKENAILVKVRE